MQVSTLTGTGSLILITRYRTAACCNVLADCTCDTCCKGKNKVDRPNISVRRRQACHGTPRMLAAALGPGSGCYTNDPADQILSC